MDLSQVPSAPRSQVLREPSRGQSHTLNLRPFPSPFTSRNQSWHRDLQTSHDCSREPQNQPTPRGKHSHFSLFCPWWPNPAKQCVFFRPLWSCSLLITQSSCSVIWGQYVFHEEEESLLIQEMGEKKYCSPYRIGGRISWEFVELDLPQASQLHQTDVLNWVLGQKVMHTWGARMKCSGEGTHLA